MAPHVNRPPSDTCHLEIMEEWANQNPIRHTSNTLEVEQENERASIQRGEGKKEFYVSFHQI